MLSVDIAKHTLFSIRNYKYYTKSLLYMCTYNVIRKIGTLSGNNTMSDYQMHQHRNSSPRFSIAQISQPKQTIKKSSQWC